MRDPFRSPISDQFHATSQQVPFGREDFPSYEQKHWKVGRETFPAATVIEKLRHFLQKRESVGEISSRFERRQLNPYG